jgi:hypothetical protein
VDNKTWDGHGSVEMSVEIYGICQPLRSHNLESRFRIHHVVQIRFTHA